ncbi:hypothetical protein MMC13_002608 [Lambiella insularis]|nr:hypothetical protein [Lambiella insularis]
MRHEDGREERQDLLGESLAEVAPGFLPRTLEELRAGATHESLNQAFAFRSINPLAPSLSAAEEAHVDPEDRIFDLPSTSTSTEHIIPSSTHPTIHSVLHSPTAAGAVVDTEPEDGSLDLSSTLPTAGHSLSTLSTTQTSSSINLPPLNSLSSAPQYEDRLANVEDQFLRVATLRREVQNLRIGIERIMSGLQELGETVTESQDSQQHTEDLTTRLGHIEAYINSYDTPHGSMDVDHQQGGSVSHRSPDIFSNFQARPTPLEHSALPESPRAYINNNTTTDGRYPYGNANLRYRRQPQPRPRTLVRSETQAQPGAPNPRLNLSVAERQLLTARQRVEVARRDELTQQYHTSLLASNHDQAQTALTRMRTFREQCERDLQNLERSQQQNTTLFGSREEIENQNYESPITGLFNTYDGRYAIAEEQRRQERVIREIIAAEEQLVDSAIDNGIDPSSSFHSIRSADEFRRDLQGASQPPATSRGIPQNMPSSIQGDASVRRMMTVPQGVPGVVQHQNFYSVPTIPSFASTNTLQGTTPGEASTSIPVSDSGSNGIPTFLRSSARGNQVITSIQPTGSTNGRRRTHHRNIPDDRIAQVMRNIQHRIAHETGSAATSTDRERLERVADGQAAERERLLRQLHAARAQHADLHTLDGVPLSAAEMEILLGGVHSRAIEPVTQLKSLDKDDGRPPPIVNEDDMMVKMECKICFSQVATVAITPCGHCVMCRWCANEAIPSHKADQNIPASRSAQCPVCRKKVKSMQTIYGGEMKEPKPKSGPPAEGSQA